jgi:hypothetical protein
MKVFMFMLLCIALVLPIISYADKDYNYFDRQGRYQGFARDTDREVNFYDNKGRNTGWISKDVGAVFGPNNRFEGFIMDTGNDD